MSEHIFRLPKFYAHYSVKTESGKTVNYDYRGDPPEKLMDAYKKIIGDGQAKVTVTTDFGMKSFGEGVSSMCAVTLTCGQNEEQINEAAVLAQELATDFAKQCAMKAMEELKEIKAHSVQSLPKPNYGT